MSFVNEKNLENEMLLYKFYNKFLFDKMEDYMNYYMDDFDGFKDFNDEDEYFYARCYYEFMFIVIEELYSILRHGKDGFMRVNLLAYSKKIARHAKLYANSIELQEKCGCFDDYVDRVHKSVYAQLCHLKKDVEEYMNR